MPRITVLGDLANLPGASSGSKSWGGIFRCAPPVNGDFAWINQGGATVTDLGGAIGLAAPANSGDSFRIRKKTAPSPPYTIGFGFSAPLFFNDFFNAGFVWRQSSDGKLVAVTISTANGGASLAVHKFNSPTSFSASYTAPALSSGYGYMFLKLEDNNTNRIVSFSADGENFVQLHSVGRTDFLTADEIGFGVDANNASNGAVMTVFHWQQS